MRDIPDLSLSGSDMEASGAIALHTPARASPRGLDLLQGGAASSTGAEPAGVFAHLRFVVRFQNGAHDFLQELLLPGGQSERLPPSFLLYAMHTSDWHPSVAFVTTLIKHAFDRRQGYAVHGFIAPSFMDRRPEARRDRSGWCNMRETSSHGNPLLLCFQTIVPAVSASLVVSPSLGFPFPCHPRQVIGVSVSDDCCGSGTGEFSLRSSSYVPSVMDVLASLRLSTHPWMLFRVRCSHTASTTRLQRLWMFPRVLIMRRSPSPFRSRYDE